MKMLRISLVVAGLMSLIGASSASAAMMGLVKPEVLGGINIMTNDSGSTGYEVGLDLTFGLGAVDFTVGGMFLSRAFTGGFSNVNYIQIPAILRFPLFPMLSIGAGGFYDAPVSSGALSNYGITGALKLKPLAVPVFLEGRYNYGLNSTNWLSDTSEVQILLGLAF